MSTNTPAATQHKGSKGSPTASAARSTSQKPASGGSSKFQTFVVRSIWTFVMISGLVAVVLAGHLPLALMILFLEILAFREVINITTDPKSAELPWGRTISWYFLITTLFYLEGDALFKFFHNVGIVDRLLTPMANYHRIVSYTLYIIGFMFFVLTLRAGHYVQQYSQLCITHMALLMVVVQGHFIAENILYGLFWFLVPASLVVVNDISAYVCGITFGRTPLISISPKKTVEGFLGAWVFTVIFGLIITYYGSTSDYMVCPMERLGVTAFSDYTCTHNSVFNDRVWQLPKTVAEFVGRTELTFAPVYIHVMALATFASLIAPFGGFFASGLKRAFKVKDFGDTIPGHGGVVDRFDCQFIMGYFAYLYVETFILPPEPTDINSLANLVLSLPHIEQLELLEVLSKAVRPAI